MAMQFVQKEDDRLLERLKLEKGLSRAEIIHRALEAYSEPPKAAAPFNPSDLAGVAQDIRGRAEPIKQMIMTATHAAERVAWMRAQKYSEDSINKRIRLWTIIKDTPMEDEV